MKSRWFDVGVGLKQGCMLSPLLFNLYTSDLPKVLSVSGNGITCGNVQIHSLLYADDICIIAESGEDLQVMLTSLSEWCSNWDLNINTSKTQVVHFHSKSVPRSTFKFYIKNKELEIVSQYRYLGLVLEESLDMSYTAKIVAQSATRALGVLINKFKAHGGMPYETYTRLFYSLVQQVLEYAAPVWAYRDHSCISAVQHKPDVFSLGLGVTRHPLQS